MNSSLSDEKLFEYDRMGLIPGPGEKETAFLSRVDYCLRLKEILRDDCPAELPPATFDDDKGVLEAGCRTTETTVGTAPRWVPLAVGNTGLAPWHGGCAWIFQQTEDSPKGALLQLRKRCRWITPEEVAAHELCHIGRMAFEEPRYEEVLAYTCSSSPWRKWLGAIVETRMESFWFVLSLLVVLILDLSTLFWGGPAAFLHVQWAKLLPFYFATYGGYRLWRKVGRFRSCLKNLEALADDPLHIAYRLTDKEIDLFAQSPREEIVSYIQNQTSLRWRAIANHLQI